MGQDLRSFLAELEEERPEEVLRIERSVSPTYELTAVVRSFEAKGHSPVFIFENVEGTRFPVVVNVNGSLDRIARSIGTTASRLTEEYLRREARGISPVRVQKAPVQEVVVSGNTLDLAALPRITHFANDGGAYITAGIVIVRDPESGERNLSCHRLMFIGKDRLAIHMEPGKHLREAHAKAEEKGEPLEVAVSLGNHPAWYLGALYIGPYAQDEMEVVGALMGEPLEVVPGKTISLEVPARAEMVLEAELLPGVRTEEGPFSDFTGYAGERATNRQVLRVRAITHRQGAMFQDITNGDSREHLSLPLAGLEANLHRTLRRDFPTLKALRFIAPFVLAVSFKKRNEGHAQNLILSAFATDIMLKYVIAVDEDIDVSRMDQILWAMGCRTQGDRDILTIKGTRGCDIDPSAPDGVVTKVGIDATAKPSLAHFQAQYPPRLPEEILARVQAVDWLEGTHQGKRAF